MSASVIDDARLTDDPKISLTTLVVERFNVLRAEEAAATARFEGMDVKTLATQAKATPSITGKELEDALARTCRVSTSKGFRERIKYDLNEGDVVYIKENSV